MIEARATKWSVGGIHIEYLNDVASSDLERWRLWFILPTGRDTDNICYESDVFLTRHEDPKSFVERMHALVVDLAEVLEVRTRR